MSALAIEPLAAPPAARIRPPGSKSITNRALLCASLAPGTSVLSGALLADDTRAMIGAVAALGARLEVDEDGARITVDGARGAIAPTPSRVDAAKSGTTSRFILPALALSAAEHVVDGDPQLRARPFAPLIDALTQLGARIGARERPGHLPLAVAGPARGGPVRIAGDVSSQFLSGLLMAAPLMERGIDVELTSAQVSEPYVAMTLAVMRAFGVAADGLRVAPAAYVAAELAIEPDASAAAYFLAAAAITGGSVTVEGLGSDSIQGDVAFAGILERMGARVDRARDRTTVTGGALHGVDVDMSAISDTAQTLAAVAAFADSPTRVRGIGFIRAKETDRIAATVNELRRAGIDASAEPDGFTVTPGPQPRPARFATYDDHRMAMSLALLGLRVSGIEIDDPGCVAKTYPGFFADLERLRR
jgi:3-phosphoshikimate 1-carboxyvinyltransferase